MIIYLFIYLLTTFIKHIIHNLMCSEVAPSNGTWFVFILFQKFNLDVIVLFQIDIL